MLKKKEDGQGLNLNKKNLLGVCKVTFLGGEGGGEGRFNA